MCELPPSHINAAYNSCPDQVGCVRLPRPVRVRVRSAAPISEGAHVRGCELEMGIGSRTGYI